MGRLTDARLPQGGASRWTLFPPLRQQRVKSLVALGRETDFGLPDVVALTRLQSLVDAFVLDLARTRGGMGKL